MIYAPLWQDIYFETSAYTVLNYSVRTSDTTGTTDYIIYKGKAYAQPNNGYISIKLNPIVDKYMGNGLPEGWYPNGSSDYPLNNYTKAFYLFNDDSETVLESYDFRYTYDEDFVWHNMSYEEAITYPQYSGMTEEQYYTQWPDGAILGLYEPVKQNSYHRNINGHITNGQYEFRTFIQETAGVNQFKNAITKYIGDSCYKGDMAVYYLGKCGCWNYFLFEGKCVRTDDFTHYDYGTDGYNTMTGNPEYSATIKRYCNEQITKYECTTSWLTDRQSELFAQDFVPSVQILIHDLRKDKIYPAVIEDTSVETKRFKNNREMNQYTVTFRVAKDYYLR